MKFIRNILMTLLLTIFLTGSGITLSAIANFLASNMTITSVYIVIFSILIILKIKERRD